MSRRTSHQERLLSTPATWLQVLGCRSRLSVSAGYLGARHDATRARSRGMASIESCELGGEIPVLRAPVLNGTKPRLRACWRSNSVTRAPGHPSLPSWQYSRFSRGGIAGASPQNSGRERGSLIAAEISLIANLNSLQGGKKFPVPMRRELACKPLVQRAFLLPLMRRRAPKR